MRKITKSLGITLLVGTISLAPATLTAQVRAGAQAQQAQMQQMQQRLQQNAQALGESIQQMQRIQQRAQQIQQSCDQAAQALQQQNLAQGQQQQLRAQTRIGEMANAISGAAPQMTVALEGLQSMAQDPSGNWNPDAVGEMSQLRERLHQVTGELEEGLQVMEQLRQRLNQGG